MSARTNAADRWRKLLHQHGSSGLTITAFCHLAGVSQPSFYTWRRKLRDEITFAEVKLARESVVALSRDARRKPLPRILRSRQS